MFLLQETTTSISHKNLCHQKRGPQSPGSSFFSSPAPQPPTESQYEMIDQFVHRSSKAKAGDGDPTSVDTANPVTGEQVEPGYTETADTGDGGDKPDGQYEEPHVSIGTNQIDHTYYGCPVWTQR